MTTATEARYSTNEHHQQDGAPGNSSVRVNVSESVGIMILGFLFVIVLFSLLRTQKRERKLLAHIADLQSKLAKFE